MADNEVRIKVTADDQATREVGGIAARIKALAKDVKIKIDVDKDRLTGALTEVEKLTAGFGNAALGAAHLSLGVAAIGGAIGALGPIVNGLATAIVQLTGLIGLVPAGLGMIAAAAATVMIAMQGNSAAFNQVKSAIQGLQPAWQSLANTLNAQLFAGIGKEIADLGRTYIPILRTSLSGMASDMNNVIRQVAEVFKMPSTANDMTVALENIRGAFRNILEAVTPLTRVFIDVFTVGAQVLNEVTAGAGNAARSLQQMVQAARESGQLKQWIEGGVQALKNLFDIGVNVVGIIQAIFRPAGGDGANFLNTVKEISAEFKAWLNSPEIKQGLTDFWNKAQELGRAFLDFLRTIGPLLDPIVKIIGDFAKAVVENLTGAFQALNPLLKPLLDFLVNTSPLWAPAAGGAVALGLAMKGISAGLSLITSAAIAPLSSLLTSIAGIAAGGSVAALLGMAGAIVLVAAAVNQLAEATGVQDKKNIFEKIHDELTGKGDSIGEEFAQFIEEWKRRLAEFGKANEDFTKSWDKFWADLGANLGKWFADRIADWNKFWADVGANVAKFFADFGANWNKFWADVGANLTKWFADRIADWNKFWADVGASLAKFIADYNASWNQFWASVGTGLQTAWNGFLETIRTACQNILKAIEDMVNAAIAAINSLLTALGQAQLGNATFASFPGGINPTSAFGNASGGIIGSRASGGGISGYTLVGERGPELVRLPWGSMVYGNAQSEGMMNDFSDHYKGRGRHHGHSRHHVHFSGHTDSAMATAIMRLIREGKIQIRMA